jgi:two-component system response regulator
MTSLPCVLLVEDNADDETLLREAFRRARVGHPLDVARDGIEAIERTLDVAPERRPALMLLDLKLPRLSGFDVLEKLRGDARTRTLPVVVVSSSQERADIERSYACGANSYLVKPLDFAELEAMIRDVARYWLRHNEPPP